MPWFSFNRIKFVEVQNQPKDTLQSTVISMIVCIKLQVFIYECMNFVDGDNDFDKVLKMLEKAKYDDAVDTFF